MTSIPASRSARAITFAPRSCPSRPGLATRILSLDSGIAVHSHDELSGGAVAGLAPEPTVYPPDGEAERLEHAGEFGRSIVANEVRRRKEAPIRRDELSPRVVAAALRIEAAALAHHAPARQRGFEPTDGVRLQSLAWQGLHHQPSPRRQASADLDDQSLLRRIIEREQARIPGECPAQ